MKFVLFVEGDTEKIALPLFLKRWLDPQLTKPVRVSAVNLGGWPNYVKEVANRARLHLDTPRDESVITVIGLLDLFRGPEFKYPRHCRSASECVEWATKHIEAKVRREEFHQFFAVHETEAWLLSRPEMFPPAVAQALPKKKAPEQVNFDEPPAKLLKRLYRQKTRRGYIKTVDGPDLFAKLNPKTAYSKCPNFKHLLDEMLALAQAAGC